MRRSGEWGTNGLVRRTGPEAVPEINPYEPEKKTLAAYIFLAVLGVLGCWLMTWQICEGWEQMLTGGNGRGQLLYIQMADGTMGFARQIEARWRSFPVRCSGR